jgi:hypothetical protein
LAADLSLSLNRATIRRAEPLRGALIEPLLVFYAVLVLVLVGAGAGVVHDGDGVTLCARHGLLS